MSKMVVLGSMVAFIAVVTLGGLVAANYSDDDNESPSPKDMEQAFKLIGGIYKVAKEPDLAACFAMAGIAELGKQGKVDAVTELEGLLPSLSDAATRNFARFLIMEASKKDGKADNQLKYLKAIIKESSK